MKGLLSYLINLSFSFFDSFFSKNKVVFSCRGAKDYSENSKVLFEKFLKEGVEEVYFYTKNKEVLKKIPKNGVYAYSWKGISTLLRAKIFVFTHGSGDFSPFFPNNKRNRIYINLFHAIAVKQVGHRSQPAAIKEAKQWDYFVVSSSFEANFIKEQYSLPSDKILVIGQPRNDRLIAFADKKNKGDKKIILYAPTFRDTSLTQLFPFPDKHLLALDEFLEENGMEIMLRLHINESKVYKKSKEYESLKNIYFAGADIYPSVNDILERFHAVITDYSSIALDFLLLNRPVAYIPYDYEQYNIDRGFSFDFYEHALGEILTTQKELLLFLLKEQDDFEKKRLQLKDKFHKYQDGKITDRLFNFIRTVQNSE